MDMDYIVFYLTSKASVGNKCITHKLSASLIFQRIRTTLALINQGEIGTDCKNNTMYN